jgi:hypothetical protein
MVLDIRDLTFAIDVGVNLTGCTEWWQGGSDCVQRTEAVELITIPRTSWLIAGQSAVAFRARVQGDAFTSASYARFKLGYRGVFGVKAGLVSRVKPSGDDKESATKLSSRRRSLALFMVAVAFVRRGLWCTDARSVVESDASLVLKALWPRHLIYGTHSKLAIVSRDRLS